jgi:hypothetical protein
MTQRDIEVGKYFNCTPEDEFEELINMLQSQRFQELMSAFTSDMNQDNPTVTFWWHYMEMVSILLMFIRAQRNGL